MIPNGERLEPLGIAYGEPGEPFVLEHQPPEAIWSDQQADEDEADDGRDAEAREHGDDDPRRAQYYQAVGHYGFEVGGVHRPSMSDSA